MSGASLAQARAAKAAIAEWLENVEQVGGIGIVILDGGYGVKVNVTEAEAAVSLRIPEEVDGVPVIVEVTGGIRPL